MKAFSGLWSIIWFLGSTSCVQGSLVEAVDSSKVDASKELPKSVIDHVDGEVAHGGLSPDLGHNHRLRRHASHARVHLSSEEKEASRAVSIMLFIIVSSQYILFMWKKRHFDSYQSATLVGVWIFPVCFNLYMGFWRFVGVWAVYSLISGYFVRLATGHPMKKEAPAAVYSWFLRCHQTTHLSALTGYLLGMLDFLGISPLSFLATLLSFFWTSAVDKNEQHAHILASLRVASITLLFYGLYFGVLTRDVAEVCTRRISAALGLAKKGGEDRELNEWERNNTCALCGLDLRSSTMIAHPCMTTNQKSGQKKAVPKVVDEPLYELECKHIFHESCIRGWAIVGKHDTCPYCVTPVNLGKILGSSPWQKQSLVWIHLLDAVRYLIVWHPLILAIAHLVLKIFMPHALHAHTNQIEAPPHGLH